jgi:hypothetical protein
LRYWPLAYLSAGLVRGFSSHLHHFKGATDVGAPLMAVLMNMQVAVFA